MKTTFFHKELVQRLLKKQEGATLFFAMIGLVVLLLAAAALVRTVDTNTLVVGNIAFRQAATRAGDIGMEDAMTWLDNTMTNAALPVGGQAAIDYALNATKTSIQASGYYSSSSEVDLFDTSSATYAWEDGRNTDLGTDAATGNRIRYVVERMCNTAGVLPDEDECLFTSIQQDIGHKSGAVQAIKPNQALIFRITVRVDGPRNTVSYIQGFVY